MAETTTIRVLRPDDLVVLRIEAVNLVLDTSDASAPKLVRGDPQGDAFLIVHFPAQSMAEEAFLEPQQILFVEVDTAKPAGETGARLAGPSRLAFGVPPEIAAIPYTTAALLDWSALTLMLSPAAAVPAGAQPRGTVHPGPPGALETAIEQPYRLVMAPGPDTTFTAAQLPVVSADRTELWHARLAHPAAQPGEHPSDVTKRNPASARAVHSPDYRGAGAGPDPNPQKDPEPGFLSPMSAEDRHDLVALMSGFGDYEILTRLELFGLRSGAGAVITPQRASIEVERTYVPEAAEVQEWMLSALGGWLRLRGAWGTPAGRPHNPAVKIALSSWKHVATEGRDHFVEIVREGMLYPFGHRAARVKITERRFEAQSAGDATPVARLRQFQFIIVRQPERAFDLPYAHGGREMPLRKLRLLTLESPHIMVIGETFNGAPIQIGALDAHWIRARDGALVPFHCVSLDADGGSPQLTANLIFATDQAVATGATQLRDAYMAEAAGRICPVPGHSVAFAKGPRGQRETALTTHAMTFDVDVQGETLLPKLDKAQVRIPAVEALLGPGKAVEIGLYGEFLESGLDADAGVFAQLTTAQSLTFSADLAGGLSTPNSAITGVGALKGAISGKLENAAQGVMASADIFGALDAQLLGAVSLKDLLPALGSADHAPVMRSQLEGAGAARRMVTTIDWEPPTLNDGPAGSVFRKQPGTTLSIQARIEQPLPEPPKPGDPLPPVGPPTTSMTGTLSAFHLSILGVIEVRFTKLGFAAGSGRKTSVDVGLSPDPVSFTGDLEFIQQLADIIPPGLLGADGPAIDVTPAGVQVGYSLPLPPLSIGIFSLQNLAIAAGLELPFANGRPALDVSFAKRDHPFILTVSGLGGGGFVHVRLDPEAIRVVEAQLEFGGQIAINLGVASGSVSIMAGIYFKLEDDKAQLDGFVDLLGEVSVLGLVSVSVEFNLTLSYSDGKATGRATLTVSIHVACFSKSVSMSVERSFGTGDGDPPIGELVSPSDWASYASAFA